MNMRRFGRWAPCDDFVVPDPDDFVCDCVCGRDRPCARRLLSLHLLSPIRRANNEIQFDRYEYDMDFPDEFRGTISISPKAHVRCRRMKEEPCTKYGLSSGDI